jgi:GMP synthase (glutamine-hydrolysing)
MGLMPGKKRRAVPVALVLQHQEDTRPGLVGEYLEHAHVTLDVRRLDRGDSLPESLDPFALLVVLGGDMNVGEEATYPFLSGERELLAEALRREFPTLGICLGAQQLAAAAGGGVTERPTLQVGWYKLRYEHFDPIVAEFDRRAYVFQWRRYACVLPQDAVLIADDEEEPQIFRVGERAWGVQGHVEIDKAILWSWLDGEPEVADVAWPKGLKDLRKISRREFYRSAMTCGQLMHNFLLVTDARGDGGD